MIAGDLGVLAGNPSEQVADAGLGDVLLHLHRTMHKRLPV